MPTAITAGIPMKQAPLWLAHSVYNVEQKTVARRQPFLLYLLFGEDQSVSAVFTLIDNGGISGLGIFEHIKGVTD